MAESSESKPPVVSAVELVGRPEQLRGQTVHAGVEIGLIDELGETPRSAPEIATELELSEAYLERLLRALDVYGVVEEVTSGRYGLTDVGERFQRDHPESVQDYLQFFYNPTRLAAIRHLPAVVASGDPTSYELEYGRSMFELFDDDPEFSEQFNGMQDLSSLGETEEIVETLATVDLAQFSTVCDVGGGYGDLLSRLLDRHPHLEGKLLELPSVLADEDQLWPPERGVEDRCEYVEGDMFERIPAADIYFLKAILHDWSDDDCVRILSNIHEAAPSDGRLFVRERLVAESDPAPETIDMDMWMMLETGGRERTRAEFEALFDRAGWAIDTVLAVDEDISIMDCQKQAGA